MKTAIFLPNWVGDGVMATPAIRKIKTCNPDWKLTAVGLPHLVETLKGNPYLDEMIIRHPKGHHAEQKGWGLFNKLRAEKFEQVLLLTNSFRSAWQGWWTGASKIVGFDRDYRGLMLTEKVPCPDKKEPHPVIIDYLKLAGALVQKDFKLTLDDYQMNLFLTEQDEMKYQQFREQIAGHIPQQASYICLNPGGAFGAAKHWPASYFGRLAQKIVHEQGYGVVVLCGPAERQIAEEIVGIARLNNVITLKSDQIGIGLSKAIVKHSSFMVATDSGPRHFAAAFGVPVVTLFGPTHIPWSETFFDKAIHLQEDVPCGPCQKRVCPLGHHRCMNELSVDKVFQQLLRLQQMQDRLAA